MKKIIIALFIFFISFNFVSASIDYSYSHTIDNCFVSQTQLSSNSTNTQVFVYRIYSDELTFEILSGNRLRVFISTELHTTCGVSAQGITKFNTTSFLYNTPYTFTNDYYGVANVVYAYFYLSTDPNGGSINWGTSSVVEPEPESDPTIPHITISDHDFYLFYDFAAISNFNIFEDYDFTNFTDFEKIIVTIVINILYLLFVFVTLYVLLKAINKLVSWVFR